MMMDTEQKLLKGGEFLITETDPSSVFIVEDLTEEQNMVLGMANEFVNKKVLPVADQIEKLDLELTKKLLKEAGDLGLLGTSFPEEYGGFMQNFETNMALTAALAPTRSFSLSHGAHTGIGMLPILYFGTEAQKQKYLPPCIAGDKFAAYCLTEPTSGSDALSAKTQAVLSEDGKHYIVNGQKMWITNAGFADVFTVFAQVDGDKFTGFIIEKDWEGVSLGAEEQKLGIKGSSTRQVFFENVKVPVENLLGEIGKGHKIAFNILNIGRIKLCAGVLGASKTLSTLSIQYANERKQFGKNIGQFGAIKYKLGEQATRIYAVESAMHRAGRDISRMEHKLTEEGKPLADALLGAAEEYAIECAILKVYGSECLDYCADEGLQIHGGMGYSEEMHMAGAYRDARINRIFEGTNEINRMLTVDMLMKRVLKGEMDMMTPAMAVQKELTGMPSMGDMASGLLADEKKYVANLKKLFLAVAGATIQKLMQALQDEQEILMNLADIMSEIYVCESAILATLKACSVRGEEACKSEIAMTQLYVNDAIERCGIHAKNAVAAWADGDTKRMIMLGIKRFTKHEFLNTKELRRTIADQLLEANQYCFK
ncbi:MULTISPECIES: acyl-CoA dehydrogenase family protein [unclassified Aureispira]|uniref:acyl-CoA dehydrogenase family protein n=1 Tax=unclassified Aureispira TaxID=2649989 RepID=UPI0006962F4D|nr:MULTISPECIES: acyl-CoA dehydrogenase family protein [unclassified Aureispira]WMX14174.1 acyl-CoA dehydrogenase family protein [Aureispira sp. CCB-E]